MKKFRKSIWVFLILFFPSIMKAEGQDGIGKMFSFFDVLMQIFNGFIFTFFIGFIIKLLLKKNHGNQKHQNFISFSIALLIVILLQICYQEKFTYLIYNNL